MRIMLDDGAYMPMRTHREDAGWDLAAKATYVVRGHGAVLIDTGVHVELPTGTVGMLKSRSGLNIKHGIVSEGVIDAGFTGSIKVKLYNHSDSSYVIEPGDRITQLVVLQLYDVDELELADSISGAERGDAGYGSSGK